jgi:hypothetical protein
MAGPIPRTRSARRRAQPISNSSTNWRDEADIVVVATAKAIDAVAAMLCRDGPVAKRA